MRHLLYKSVFVLVAITTGLTAIGCGIARQGMVKENVTKMTALSVGMSKEEVSRIMGTEAMIGVKNPERREIFQRSSGTVVDVWFYRTDQFGSGDKERLTPVIFENDKLVGIGWRMLEDTSKVASPPPEVSRRSVTSQGTAFAVRPDGTFITAFHIVKDARQISVICPGQAPAPATLMKSAQVTDLAILRTIRPTPSYPSLVSANTLHPGDAIFTVGYPATSILGKEPKYTDGSVNSLYGPDDDAAFLQMSAPVQPGNSGGPLLNREGQVVGIVTSTAALRNFLSGTGTLPQNVNWAVKADYARTLFDPPTALPSAGNLTDAIERAMNATCIVEATK